jgi:hypothetical protein
MKFLTNNERLQIELKRREVRSKKEHVRLSVLIMLDEGFSHETIALCLGIHAGSVENWKQKYESACRDLNQYLSDKYVAFPGSLSQEQLTDLISNHFQPPMTFGRR